jgi:hypothetical protein
MRRWVPGKGGRGRSRLVFFALAGMMVPCGCKSPRDGGRPPSPQEVPFADGFRLDVFQDNRSAAENNRSAKPSAFHPDNVKFVQLVFDVVRVDLPVESVRHSRKIWNHVDEMRVGPEVAARLARNGIRCGVAGTAALPAITTILEAARAKSYPSRVAAQSGVPVTLLVGELREPESIFTFNRLNGLVGKTIPAGHKVIVLDYAPRPEFGGFTDLVLAFQVRHDRGTMTLQREEDVLYHVPAVDRHAFPDLDVQVSVRPSEMLVIGPSEKAEMPYLIGSRFFAREDPGGILNETILFITPRIDPGGTERR